MTCLGDPGDAFPARRVIRRETSGGTLRITDLRSDAQTQCASCGGQLNARLIAARPAVPSLVALLGVEFTGTRGAADGATLTTAICADCLSEALAILFGRRHVQAGGDLDELHT